jgi:hypothetical protein
MPLSIRLEAGTGTAMYRQIIEQVCIAWAAGELAEGEAMTPARDLRRSLA